MYRREETKTLTWTSQVIADGVADDDATILMIDGADEVYVEISTVGATTGAPDFDFHVETSDDKSTFSNSHWTTLVSALAKNKVDPYPFNAGAARYARIEMDVNTANLVEFVTAKVRIRWN